MADKQINELETADYQSELRNANELWVPIQVEGITKKATGADLGMLAVGSYLLGYEGDPDTVYTPVSGVPTKLMTIPIPVIPAGTFLVSGTALRIRAGIQVQSASEVRAYFTLDPGADPLGSTTQTLDGTTASGFLDVYIGLGTSSFAGGSGQFVLSLGSTPTPIVNEAFICAPDIVEWSATEGIALWVTLTDGEDPAGIVITSFSVELVRSPAAVWAG